MNTASLIGQDSYVSGLQKQAATQAAALQGAGKSMDKKQVHEAAEKFEAFFISQMMDHMTAGIETDPLFGGGHGEDMWKSMLNQEYGKGIAKSGTLGVTDQVMKGMIKMQEERTAAAQAANAALAPAAAAPMSAIEQNPAMHALAAQDAAIALVAGARTPIRR